MKKTINLFIIKILKIKCFIKRIYNHFTKNDYVISEKGIKMYDYLLKVITENYQPITIQDYIFENIFNKEYLIDSQRKSEAIRYFCFLEEHLPLRNK